jgi:hypothetical protein
MLLTHSSFLGRIVTSHITPLYRYTVQGIMYYYLFFHDAATLQHQWQVFRHIFAMIAILYYYLSYARS